MREAGCVEQTRGGIDLLVVLLTSAEVFACSRHSQRDESSSQVCNSVSQRLNCFCLPEHTKVGRLFKNATH